MAHVNHGSREITAKLVYCGPGRSGKTTNLQHVHASSRADRRGQLISLSTEGDQTLYFDLFSLSLGRIAGFEVRLHVYTVPGQVLHARSRELVLRGVDGLCFVADSCPDRLDANVESLENLRGLVALRPPLDDPDAVPMVLQLNMRDCVDALPCDQLARALECARVPTVAAVATTGEGVLETFRLLSRLVVGDLRASLETTPGSDPPQRRLNGR